MVVGVRKLVMWKCGEAQAPALDGCTTVPPSFCTAFPCLACITQCRACDELQGDWRRPMVRSC